MEIDNNTIQQDDHQVLLESKKKKCHGNRKDQRFRKKWRMRGMNSRKIEKLLAKRKKNNNSNIVTTVTEKDQRQTTTTTTTTTSSIPRNDLKRKRDRSLHSTIISKSISSVSMRQSTTKKMKKKRKDPIITTMTTTVSTINEHINLINIHYRQPMYLKRSSFILFKLLQKIFKQVIKDKSEQKFIYLRLNLLDQHYFLEAHQNLWQSYLNIGLEQYRWPEEICKMAKTDNFELCKQYLINYIENIKKQINSLERKLIQQIHVCPITWKTIEQIDQNLKEFIDCQRKYLLQRNTYHLEKFKKNIQTNQLFNVITNYYPTIDQNEFVHQLINIREKQIKIWEEQLMLETRILCRFLPLEFDYLQDFIVPNHYTPFNNEQKIIQINNQHYKLIQETKRQWLHSSFYIYEIKLQDYDQQYQEIFIQLKSILLNNTSLQGHSLFNQISEYLTNLSKELKQNTIKKMSIYQRKLIRNRQRVLSSLSQNNIIGVSPEPYLDLISNPFDKREWHHLSLGPSCIRLNQSAIRQEKYQQIEVKHIHEDIFLKVQNHLVEYYHIPRNLSIFDDYSNQLRNYLYNIYFTPLSYKNHMQAKEQAQIVASIRKKLRQNQLIIRVTDKSNNFYIGSSNEFEKKVQKYFTDTNAYLQLVQNPFDDVLNKVIQLLNQLRTKKFILKWQYDEMIPDPKQTELAHLYFNPKTHKDGIPVRPIINAMHASTTKISKFLDSIIRPIFDDKCRQTTIIDGSSLIQNLRQYQQKGLLKSSTLFCTFDIHNLYTMLPQDESLNILIEFLLLHGYRKIKGVPLDTIRKLASIVIKENVFVYEKQFYRQIIGGAMGSSFTLTLANIFMWKWQKQLVRIQDMTGEYFGRYIDDIFITWNRSEKDLKKLLNQANQWHPNIQLEYKISQSLPFLDVHLTNKNGILYTSVYHKPTTEPYVVPFISDHHPHMFRNIIRTILQRAIRYSSTLEIFQHERRSIKLMLLYNGYPSTFIDHQFQQFFGSSIDLSSFLPYIYDEQQFILLHRQINNELTPRQSQVAQSAAIADIANEQTDDDPKPLESTIRNKSTSYRNKLFIHYTHEKRFRTMKRDLHHVYENTFKNTPAMDLKLVVANRNRRTATDEFIRKKPKLSLLQNKARQIKNKYKKFLSNLLPISIQDLYIELILSYSIDRCRKMPPLTSS